MWQALSQRQLTLDQTSTPLQIDRYEVEEFYYPLALELIALGKAAPVAAQSDAEVAPPPRRQKREPKQ